MGTRLTWTIRTRESNLSSLSERHRFSPYGVFGGLPPPPRDCGHFCDTRIRINGQPAFSHATELFKKASPSKWSNITLHEGDQVELTLCGGGGWGPPYERDPEAVMLDVINGFVSPSGARDHYGVVIDPTIMKIDLEETKKTRDRKNVQGYSTELQSALKVLLTLFIANLDETQRQRLRDSARNNEIMFVRDQPQGTVVKLLGNGLDEAMSKMKEIVKLLEISDTQALTIQYVPSHWNPLVS